LLAGGKTSADGKRSLKESGYEGNKIEIKFGVVD
jgi:hypothetical protein